MNAELKITGRLAEVGNLDGGSTPGASIYAGDGRYIEVHNLSEDEARAIAPAFGEMVTVSIALAERTTAPVSLTDAQIDDMAFGYAPSGAIGELREFARALLAAAPSPEVEQAKQDKHGARRIFPPEFPKYSNSSIEAAMSREDLWDYACLCGWRAGEFEVLAAAPAPIQQATRGMEDPIMIPRGLVGAACHVIRKNMPHSMLLEKLRAYTVGGYGEISQSPPALAGSQVQAAGDAVDAARYRWLRDKARSVDWTRNLSPNSYTTACRNSANQMDTAIDAAMREQP